MSSIPAHRSTIQLLLRLKPETKNWDDFLLSAFEDWLPPETIRELERREELEPSRSFADVERAHSKRAPRRR
jgi:hypothetical protein